MDLILFSPKSTEGLLTPSSTEIESTRPQINLTLHAHRRTRTCFLCIFQHHSLEANTILWFWKGTSHSSSPPIYFRTRHRIYPVWPQAHRTHALSQPTETIPTPIVQLILCAHYHQSSHNYVIRGLVAYRCIHTISRFTKAASNRLGLQFRCLLHCTLVTSICIGIRSRIENCSMPVSEREERKHCRPKIPIINSTPLCR